MNVLKQINDQLLKARREKFEYNTLLIGRKEFEELKEVSDYQEVNESADNSNDIKDNIFKLNVLRVDSDSYLSLANML